MDAVQDFFWSGLHGAASASMHVDDGTGGPHRYLQGDPLGSVEGIQWSMNPYLQVLVIFILVALSGLFSGLTLGLLGLDLTGLDILAHGEDPQLAQCAKKIIPIRQNGNLLLCTLLLGNVAVNSLISILTSQMTSGMVGFIIATALILIFGEIVPQSACSRYSLQIGSRSVPVVKVLLVLFWPIAKPLSMMLDFFLGEEIGTVHSKRELMRLLHIHVREGALKKEEGDVVAGALKFRGVPLSKIMTKKEDCFLLHKTTRLNYDTIVEIFKTGFSRIPVYNKSENDIMGVLVTKDLIFVDPEDAMPLEQFLKVFGRHIELFFSSDTCGEALTRFKSGTAHMGLVREVNTEDPSIDPYYELKGIVTLEDIIEEILQDEIIDETDVYIDMDSKRERAHQT